MQTCINHTNETPPEELKYLKVVLERTSSTLSLVVNRLIILVTQKLQNKVENAIARMHTGIC